MFVYLCINYAKNSGHPLFGTPTGPAKMFETANVRDGFTAGSSNMSIPFSSSSLSSLF